MSLWPSRLPPAVAQSGNMAAATSSPSVISDARGHQRRRLIRLALLALCVGVGAGLIVGRTQTAPAGSRTAIPARHVSPAAVLAQAPYMGVACRLGVCDWVGLAIWLRQPAVAVTARIAGRPMRLVITNAYPRSGARATFVGYLRPYRLVTNAHLDVGSGPTSWATSLGQAPTPAVQLSIRYRNGRTLTTRVKVPLQPGWS
jgi:hypothetical protein